MSKTILITGASSGIGKATAKYFHEQGWNVVATMRKPEAEEELNQLENVLVTRLDVLDSESITTAINEGIEKFGNIDALLNNAGYGAAGTLESFSMEGVRRQFDVNVIGLLEVTKAMLPHFRAKKGGTLVNISSIGGKITFPLFSLYHGTKFAVEGISESLAYEMAEFGGKVKIIEPGAIATDFGTRSLDMKNDESIIEYQELYQKLMSGMGDAMSNASPASLAGEIIYTAVTDGTDQLRYTVGDDAAMYVKARKEQDDVAFMAGIKERFNL